MKKVKLLHTSDIHLGHNLMFADRKEEHAAFFNWLLTKIQEEKIDILILAGDIFDSGNPPNYALKMYYQFLMEVSKIETCRDVIVIGGNHDSISTLNAPKEVLSLLNVHVIGGMTANLADEIIVTKDQSGEPTSIICAVPFLHDKDVRKSTPGESYEEKSKQLMVGIKNHYEQVKEMALQMKIDFDKDLPLFATGHLFAQGASTSEGVRDIYVGSLGQFPATSFPEEFDYIALGHLHKPQIVGKKKNIRYSGSPIPLSFGEVAYPKTIIIYDSETKNCEEIQVPLFQKIVQMKGNIEEIKEQIENLKKEEDEIWLEIQVNETEYQGDFTTIISSYAENSKLRIFKIIDTNIKKRALLETTESTPSLSELSEKDVFLKRLDAHESEIDKEARDQFLQMFNEVVNEVCGGEDEN